MPAEFADPYIDPATGILRNLVGAATPDELARAEGELVSVRAGALLAGEPPRLAGSLGDLCAIHKALFRDVFDWAGQTRGVEIRKNVEGSEFFLPSADIERGAIWAKGELEADNMLAGVAPARFPERLAYHYDNYNYIHPFREGNGRTQRVFWSFLCRAAGFDIDWRQASGEENDEASRMAAEDRDLSGLVAMFERISRPCDPREPLAAGHAGGSHLS